MTARPRQPHQRRRLRRLAHWLNRGRERDRGVVVPLTALGLVILLGFTAFAVDLGILYNERRQDQSAADNAALSGGRVMIGNDSSAEVFDDVAHMSYMNLGDNPDFTEGEWYQMLAGTGGQPDCIDGDAAGAGYPDALVLDADVTAPGGTTIPSGTDVECINLDDAANPSRLRVHLPTIEVDAVFAQILGIDGYESSAFAEVGVSNPRDVGGVLPFAIAAASVSLAEICLKADSQSSIDQCDGGTTGNYGRLDLGVWGFLNASEDCAGTSNADQPLAINTAQGLDHYLATSPTATPSPIYTEENECKTNKDDDPNEAKTQTGNASNGFNVGMIGFDGEKIGSAELPDGLQGRLMGINANLDAVYDSPEYPFDAGSVNNVRDVSSDDRMLEDVPLWAFLDPALQPGTDVDDTVPIRCLDKTFDYFADKTALEAVLSSYPGLTAATYGSWTNSLTYPVQLATTQHLRDCFNDYNTGVLIPGIAPIGAPYTSILFSKDTIPGDNYVDDEGTAHTVFDIEYAHRFGWMPVIWDNTFPNGGKDVHFKTFQPIYITTVFGQCTGSGSCSFQFTPGESSIGTEMHGADAGAASAMNIQLAMLPLDVREAQQQKLLDDPPVRLLR